VGDLTKIETLLSVAVFAIPIAVFVTLVILLIRRRRRSAMPPPGQEARAPDRARPEAAPVAQPTVTQPPTVEVKGVPEIVKRIDAAIAAGQNSALAALYLDLAHGYEKLGNVEARLSALRSAAGCGSLHGPRSCHAAARL
jgi:hypothetical protein